MILNTPHCCNKRMSFSGMTAADCTTPEPYTVTSEVWTCLCCETERAYPVAWYPNNTPMTEGE